MWAKSAQKMLGSACCVPASVCHVHRPDWNVPPVMQEAERIVECGYQFLARYSCLAREALQQRRPCYKVRPKWHQLHHSLHNLAEGSRINPRLFANWNNETFIGRLTKTSSKTHPATTGLRSLQRWLLELLVQTEQIHVTPSSSSVSQFS